MDSVPPASTHSKLPTAISWYPRAIDFDPDAHALLTVYAGTSCGTPLRIEICRAGFGPPPACRALPKVVSSTCSGWTPARSSAALAATTPISAAVCDASEPPNFPIGVRTADTIYTGFNVDLPNFQSSIRACGRSSGVREYTTNFGSRTDNASQCLVALNID